VCGGPHPRKECPGIADDGRGQARWHDQTAKKRDAKEHREFEKKKESDDKVLEVGMWTANLPYYDGFADLRAIFGLQKHKDGPSISPGSERKGGSEQESSGRHTNAKVESEQFGSWVESWRALDADLGGRHASAQLTDEQRKKELKNCRAKVLREKALAIQDVTPEMVAAALEGANPRSEMIQLILKHRPADSASRKVLSEWPGYRGCVAPFSVLDEEAHRGLAHLKGLGPQGSAVKALLAIPPKEIARWMVVDNNNGGDNGDASSTVPTPVSIDMVSLSRMATEIAQAEVDLKKAKDKLVVCESQGRAAHTLKNAVSVVSRLVKVLASLRARQLDSEVVLASATKARLDPVVGHKLDCALAAASPPPAFELELELSSLAAPSASPASHPKPSSPSVVVGISCGLDYTLPEATHPQLGAVVREAQRSACRHAVSAAVKAELPIVLESNDVPLPPPSTSPPKSGAVVKAALGGTNAAEDLVRILAELVPPGTTLVLRSGSLTVANKPGLSKLLQAWPKLHIALSPSLTYSKCPKELLDVAYDVPTEKLILVSEAPLSLPAVLGTSRLTPVCLPPHVACAAAQVATIKVGVSRQEVLQASTANLCRVFGLPEYTI
jgi:Tat protein secretion system quality control protein TatD with DNase activity